jgi:hypothetical protein
MQHHPARVVERHTVIASRRCMNAVFARDTASTLRAIEDIGRTTVERGANDAVRRDLARRTRTPRYRATPQFSASNNVRPALHGSFDPSKLIELTARDFHEHPPTRQR